MSLKRVSIFGSLVATYLALSACISVEGLDQLSRVDLVAETGTPTVSALDPSPSLLDASTQQDWANQRAPDLRRLIQEDFYGRQPHEYETRPGPSTVLDASAFSGKAMIELVPLSVRARFEGGEWSERTIRLVVTKPVGTDGPLPTILKMDFCALDQVFQNENLPGDGYRCGASGFSPINRALWYSLGRYHISPPIEEMIDKGYAYASISVADYVPDNRTRGPESLSALSDGADLDTAWGALAAWAFQFSRAIDYLDSDRDLDPTRTAVYGHSRYGKSALLAGALDRRIDAVIAHQSGRGGAALTTSPGGETMRQMVETYPHWLSRGYSRAVLDDNPPSLSFDQHHLVALLAPRPVLLGHARRDQWSDPQGAFEAARGATPAYELFGVQGMTAKRLDEFDPSDGIAFWMRPGTHGETQEDWPAFFAFLDAHFGQDLE